MIATILKWISLPVLLSASLFTFYAERYELMLNVGVCLGAVFMVQRAVRANEYLWGAGYLAVAVVFSPLGLAGKIFLLMGFMGIAACFALMAALRRQRAPGWELITKKRGTSHLFRNLSDRAVSRCARALDRGWRHSARGMGYPAGR